MPNATLASQKNSLRIYRRAKAILSAGRPIISLVLVCSILLMHIPPAVARDLTISATSQAVGFIQFNKVLDDLVNLFGFGKKTGQGRDMPQSERPLPAPLKPQRPPTKAEREAKVARIEVNPSGDVILRSEQPMVFAAIPVDTDGNAIHGLGVEWESSDKQVVFITRNGQAVAGKPGKAHLTVTVGNKKEVVKVTVLEGAKERFGGKKEDSKRDKSSATKGGTSSANAYQSSNDKLRSDSQMQLAHGANIIKAALPLPMRDPNEDPLPDSETGSLYSPTNTVGDPPGRTPPEGIIPPPPGLPTTENPGSSNFSFSLPVVTLPGRGVSTLLALSYNSRVWNKSTYFGSTYLTYDVDSGWPAPGFRLSFGQIESQGSYGFTLTDSDGTRRELRKVNPYNQYDYNYETTDGTFLRFYGGRGWGTLTQSNGTQVEYGAAGMGYRSYPTKITDRNGNYILISYVGGIGPRISSVQDTMGRFVRFYYNGSGDLVAITTPGYAGGADRQTIRLYYQDISINASFQVSASAPATARVIRYAYFPGINIGYRYDYSSYGMIRQIVQFRGMSVNYLGLDQTGWVASEGQWAAQTTYNYPDGPMNLSDVPAFDTRTDDWAGRTSTQPVYHFSRDEAQGLSTFTAPDQTVTEVRNTVAPGQWSDGLISETVVKQGGAVLSRVVTSWVPDVNLRNPQVQQVKITNEANQTKTTRYGYTTYNNISSVTEYDFDQPDGSLGLELRRVETTYETRPEWTSRGLVRLPTSERVIQNGVVVSRIDYAYDTAGANLTPRGDIIMHDASYDPNAPLEEYCYWEYYWNEYGYYDYVWTCYSYSPYNPATDKRGNVTAITKYSDAANGAGPLTKTYAYDIAGNVVSATTGCCREKAFTLSKAYEYALVTSEERGSGSGQHTTSATYDFNTGLVRAVTDENGQTTNIHYYPDTLRHYRTDLPTGGFTYKTYGDGLYADPDQTRLHSYVAVTSSLDASRTVTSWQFMDGRGAVVRTFGHYTPEGHEGTTDIEYDVMGRVSRVSNPYFTLYGSANAVNPSGLWTVTQYDGLGRTISITSPDNNVKSFSYAGNVTTITDQANRSRRQVEDALGRVVRVDEPDGAGNLGTVGAPAYPTYLKYNATDKLVQITQGSQNRYFKYDSMGNMTHERQVEQDAPHYAPDSLTGNSYWSRVMSYNAQGLVAYTYDARSIRTDFSYDDINRLTRLDYSDGTPSVIYGYDQSRPGYYNRGRLTSLTTTATGADPQTAQSYDYDQTGKVLNQVQTIGGASYTVRYGYNLAGLLVSETYPSGRVVSYGFDNASRLISVADGTRTYASAIAYGAHSGLTSETFGNGAVHTIGYNNRLQISQIRLTAGGVEKQRYDYEYGIVNADTGAVDLTKNNGQVARIEGFINGARQWQQRFNYDSLGRITLAGEYRGDNNALAYRAHYDYDRYGNRYQNQGLNYNLGYIPVTAGDINQGNNRFYGLGYDAAGNVTTDNKFRGMQYQYDANSRLKNAWRYEGSGGSSSLYDGRGLRVQTTVNGFTRQMVYDVNGRIVAEYSQGVLERENIYRGDQLIATDEAPRACSLSIEQFVRNFFQQSLARQPSSSELQYWMNRLGRAQTEGFAQFLGESIALGRGLFLSQEYLARNRADRDYVYDLYKSFLLREPEPAGWDGWTSVIPSYGRDHVRRGFELSQEFQDKVSSICPSGGPGGGIRYLLMDHLGSARVVMDASASVIARHDYLPFGEEVWSDVGMRSSAQGYGVMDRNRQRYAWTEKDEGSGLENTLWRKYESWAGRWTTPDPYTGSININDPQSLNRYTYVQNDPVNLIDPTGLCLAVQYMDTRTERTWWEFYLCNTDRPIYEPYSPPETGGGGGGGGLEPQPEDKKIHGDIPSCKEYIPGITPDYCKVIAELIMELTESVEQRRTELKPGSKTYKTHVERWAAEKNALSDCISKFNTNQCGGGNKTGDLPQGFDLVRADKAARESAPKATGLGDALFNRGGWVPFILVPGVAICVACPACCAVPAIQGGTQTAPQPVSP